jgi:hypothetical protein
VTKELRERGFTALRVNVLMARHHRG